jgi:glutamyl/glutaminyl-tRNA synthetase
MDKGLLFRKTRLAPTPSGYLHLGNILSFAITVALARATKARILLRIDDLDRERADPKYIQDIFDTLHFLDIPWDDGPRDPGEFEREYSQIHRMDLYRQALRSLGDSGAVFACSCSRSQILDENAEGAYPGTCRNRGLSLQTENTCWRLRTPPEMVLRDFIVRKKDGLPAYQLTSVLDDLHYGIDLVVRGADLRPSTLAQHYLSKAIGMNAFADMRFYHHPLLLDGEQRKLSKSAGATSIQYLRRQGRTPAEIYSLIAGLSGIGTPVKNWQDLADHLPNYLVT